MNKSIVNVVIAALKEIEIDGEMMEYIINEVGMRDQMIKQLTPQDDIVELDYNKGKNPYKVCYLVLTNQ